MLTRVDRTLARIGAPPWWALMIIGAVFLGVLITAMIRGFYTLPERRVAPASGPAVSPFRLSTMFGCGLRSYYPAMLVIINGQQVSCGADSEGQRHWLCTCADFARRQKEFHTGFCVHIARAMMQALLEQENTRAPDPIR